MSNEIVQGFIRQAEECLPTIRGGILAGARTGNAYGELSASLRQIESVKAAASVVGAEKIVEICGGFERELKNFTGAKSEPLADEQSRRLLDNLAELEILLAEIYFGANDFSENAGSFIDESFERFEFDRDNRQNARNAAVEKENNDEEVEEEFEIDEEMLEIFALEAEELVRRINRNLEILEQTPQNERALLEIRRDAHTLKGSAGIVGLKKLAQLAHRAEDLLDSLAANEIAGDAKIFASLMAAIDCFEPLARRENSAQLEKKIERVFAAFDDIADSLDAKKIIDEARGKIKSESQIIGEILQTPDTLKNSTETPIQPKNAPAQNRPVVRVSLEKIDELVKIAVELASSSAFFQKRIDELERHNADAPQTNLEIPLDEHRRSIEEMREKLRRLRMVSFGTLAARLQRTVRVTCDEEEKIAELFIAGEATEIDTQILDSLVEPLLHLLRNAVAHGIEAPELRRLLGKPETGRIDLRVFVPADDKTNLVVTISDDGRGISADALREKAVAGSFISRARADKMIDAEAFELIFLPGLTTAAKLSQVAGRGFGMNVVKTCIEQKHGRNAISISSEPLKGTTFTLRLPLQPTENKNPSATAKKSVLIVDDSPSVRRATSNLLTNAGWQPTVAADGLEALEMLQVIADNAETVLPDLILTDAEMPRMDGYEFLSSVKRNERLRRIPVIMITSRDGGEYRRKAFDAGASAYLTKPCGESVLFAEIEKLVKSN